VIEEKRSELGLRKSPKIQVRKIKYKVQKIRDWRIE
jgi:hypothetical protein